MILERLQTKYTAASQRNRFRSLRTREVQRHVIRVEDTIQFTGFHSDLQDGNIMLSSSLGDQNSWDVKKRLSSNKRKDEPQVRCKIKSRQA